MYGREWNFNPAVGLKHLAFAAGQLSSLKNEKTPSEKGKERTKSHSKGELGTVAECGVIRAVDWRLSGESGVKLAHVLVRLLQSVAQEKVRMESSTCRTHTEHRLSLLRSSMLYFLTDMYSWLFYPACFGVGHCLHQCHMVLMWLVLISGCLQRCDQPIKFDRMQDAAPGVGEHPCSLLMVLASWWGRVTPTPCDHAETCQLK